MVDNIQRAQGMFDHQWAAPTPLTDDQKTQIQSILSNYDPKNLTATDAKAIMKSFREAGIAPGPELRDAISGAGFDAEQLRTLARPEGRNGHHHHPRAEGHHRAEGAGNSTGTGDGSQGLDSSALQSLKSILDQYDLTSLSADQKTNMVKQLSDAGLTHSGFMIDLSA